MALPPSRGVPPVRSVAGGRGDHGHPAPLHRPGPERPRHRAPRPGRTHRTRQPRTVRPVSPVGRQPSPRPPATLRTGGTPLEGGRAMRLGLIYAFVYRAVAAAWPAGVVRRGWRLAGLVWVGTVFAEFIGPFNVLHQPPALSLVAWAFWAIVALMEGYAIASVSRDDPLWATERPHRGLGLTPPL